MDTCDVLIVGGGPAGSACARDLRRHGVDVMIIDKARFPRDKVCAGWITPQVVADLDLDVEEYPRGRTFQRITAFSVGVIGQDDVVRVDYGRPVSYGIRRCEFDDYLLRRADVRLRLGAGVTSIERVRDRWIVNGSVAARMLVGAGGHGCPVARMIGGVRDRAPLVVAREAEYILESADRAENHRAELYLSPDLAGYGWWVRKGRYVNVGFGRASGGALVRETASFVSFLEGCERIAVAGARSWRTHAYRLSSSLHRPRVANGALVIGDAAGLAQPASGEGIGPAIESGRLAAAAIVAARGVYTVDRLRRYDAEVQRRLGRTRVDDTVSSVLTRALGAAVLRRLIVTPWFTRRLFLDGAFLRRHRPPLAQR